MEITVVRGDICAVEADAVVTAGNRSLVGGSGVNGAVHAAAGPELLRASRALAPCPAGSAVITPAFNMTNTRWVIHAVGPIYSGPEDKRLLASAYTESLARADEVGAQSVAFPAISTGIYGYPAEDAARVSVAAIRGAQTSVRAVYLVAFGERTARLWEQAEGRDVMKCEECESHSAEVVGFTDDARTEIRCTACGFHWIHGPSPEALRAGHAGGTKYHCPVCPSIYSDPTAPIVTIGTPSMAGHRCDKTKSFLLGTTYGVSEKALDQRLAQLGDPALQDWPRVLEMKHERGIA